MPKNFEVKTIVTVTCAHQYDVTLTQIGYDKFNVQYGKQLKIGLNYAQAAKEFGQCVMHAAACAGTLDNRTEAEARKDGDL